MSCTIACCTDCLKCIFCDWYPAEREEVFKQKMKEEEGMTARSRTSKRVVALGNKWLIDQKERDVNASRFGLFAVPTVTLVTTQYSEVPYENDTIATHT